ncbi:MAG: hypothetical protein V1819_00170 [bacterium]
MRKLNGILTIFTAVLFFFLVTFFTFSAYGAESTDEDLWQEFSALLGSCKVQKQDISLVRELVEAMEDKDVNRATDPRFTDRVKVYAAFFWTWKRQAPGITHEEFKKELDKFKKEVIQAIQRNDDYILQISKLRETLQAKEDEVKTEKVAHEKLVGELKAKIVELGKLLKESEKTPKGISQEEADRLTKELDEKDKINAEQVAKIAELSAKVAGLAEQNRKLRRLLAEKEEAEEPKFFRPYISLAGVDFVAPEKFSVAKWLDDKDSRFEHQIGGEIGLGLVVKRVAFMQGHVGMSGSNLDWHSGIEGGLYIKGFKIGAGGTTFCSRPYPILYASYDGFLAPFIRVQPDKEVPFLQFGLNMNFDILSVIERIR